MCLTQGRHAGVMHDRAGHAGAQELRSQIAQKPDPSDSKVSDGDPPESKTLVIAGTMSMAIVAGQLVSVLFLTYFLLAGDLFRRRLMQAMGPSLTSRKKALQILNEVHDVSRRYFALVLAMNIAVGVFTARGSFCSMFDTPRSGAS